MSKKVKETTEKTVETVAKKVVVNEKLTMYSFPKDGLTIFAKDLKDAEKKVKMIQKYKSKAL